MPITGAHHTSYTVIDMDVTLKFYRDLLGFEVINERPEVTNNYFRKIIGFPDAVVHATLLRIPGTEHVLELLQYINPKGNPQDLTPNNPGSSHICYIVDDLKSIYSQLVEKGIDFISPPVYLDEGPNVGGWSLYLRDPNRIVVEMMQPSGK